MVPKGTGIPAQIFDLMRRTRMSLPGDSTRSRLTLKTYLKMMLVLLVNYYASYRGTEAVFDRRQRDLERLRPLFEYIDENYATPMTIGDAASQVFMSKSHFTRFFRQVTGYSFISYLNRFRVSRAQLLMTNTGLSMAEISQNVGFCDQSYFGLIFKQLVHMTPREFKENRQKITPLSREN